MMFFGFSQTSLQTNVKNPSSFSSIYFSTRITCFGAQALVTCCCILHKIKGARSNFTFTCKSESELHDKQMFREKNWAPPGQPGSPQRFPLLLRPRGPSLPSPRTPPWPFPSKSAAQGWLRFDPLHWITMVAAWLPHGSLLWWSRPGSRTPPPCCNWSHSDPSDWRHHDICALSKFV